MRARAKGATPAGAAARRLPMDPGPPVHATGLAAVTGPIPGTEVGIANVSACSPEPATGSTTGLSYSAMQVSTLSGSLAAGPRDARAAPACREGARDPGVHPVGLRQRPARPGKVAGLPGVGDEDVEAPVMEKPEDAETRPAPQRVPPP